MDHPCPSPLAPDHPCSTRIQTHESQDLQGGERDQCHQVRPRPVAPLERGSSAPPLDAAPGAIRRQSRPLRSQRTARPRAEADGLYEYSSLLGLERRKPNAVSAGLTVAGTGRQCKALLDSLGAMAPIVVLTRILTQSTPSSMLLARGQRVVPVAPVQQGAFAVPPVCRRPSYAFTRRKQP